MVKCSFERFILVDSFEFPSEQIYKPFLLFVAIGKMNDETSFISCWFINFKSLD